ncbi:transglutaminase-like domain-containing protein [Blautia wexlerae]|uniref:transglutaminase-like domain-containing protein n=1 Tax=Blautia wexlerae TaxID=418240 RepID=UPI003219A136
MKKKVISMLLAVSMISTSPIYATEFSDGNSVVVNDADDVNGTDADSADSAEIPDTTLFSSDAVDGAGDVNDSVDAGGDAAENAFSDQEVPDVDDGSGSGVDAAEVNVAPNGVYDYKSDLMSSYKINAVDRAVSQIISEAGITSQNTDLEKISMIMAWLKKNTSYSNEEETGNQTPYGSLVLRRAVCGGFATGLSTVLTKMGITNYVRIGHDIEGNGHGWVEVELNNRFYILDATVRYIPYSFLEDYNGYWFKDIWESNDHTRCANTYSCKGIPASEIEYIGANGNSLYVSTNAGYYVNDGTGWKSTSELPGRLYGSSVVSLPTEIENIIGDGNLVKDPILSGSSRTTRFYISNPGAAESQEAAESLTCRVDNEQIASAKITARGKGWVDVTVTGRSAGTTTLSVSAPNGVTGTLSITASNASVSKAPVIQAVVKKNSSYIYLKWNLTKDVLDNANSMGYQIMVGNPKTGEYTLDNDVRLDESDFKKDYFASATIGFGDTKKVKVRLYEKMDDGTISYGDYSNELTVSTTPGYVRMESVSMKNNKAYLKWSKAENADGYVVYRRIGKTGKYKKIKTINSGNTLKYTNSKLTYGKKYCYKVKAFHVTPEGKKLYTNWSNVISRTCK